MGKVGISRGLCADNRDMSILGRQDKQRKCQIATDFIITLSGLMVIFLIIFAIINLHSKQLTGSEKRLESEKLVRKIGLAINTVFLSGEGAHLTVELPSTLRNNFNYTVGVFPDSRTVVLDSGGLFRSYPLVTNRVTGDLEIHTFSVHETVSITNSNGWVVISEG